MQTSSESVSAPSFFISFRNAARIMRSAPVRDASLAFMACFMSVETSSTSAMGSLRFTVRVGGGRVAVAQERASQASASQPAMNESPPSGVTGPSQRGPPSTST